MTVEYVLVRDEDSHWYVVPADLEDDFHAWAEGGFETEPLPAWAKEVGGSPSLVKFSVWRIA